MDDVLTRLALFTLLPVLLGAALVILDRSTVGPVRRAEAFLIPLFLVGVGGGGVSSFISQVFIADYDPSNAFQREFGFANLAIGVLGAVAAERRDWWRELTVVVASLFGASVAALLLLGGYRSLGNVVLAISSVAVPALLIWFLIVVRRAERAEPQTIVLRSWMIPVRRGSVFAVGIAATAFAVGNSTGQVVAFSLAGFVVAAAAFWFIVGRAASHRAATQGARI